MALLLSSVKYRQSLLARVLMTESVLLLAFAAVTLTFRWHVSVQSR